jgi:hypothetical protein
MLNNKITGVLSGTKNQNGGMQMLYLVLVTIVCWSLAAWLFWKWDVGGYRSDFQNRSKKGGASKSK